VERGDGTGMEDVNRVRGNLLLGFRKMQQKDEKLKAHFIVLNFE
jgi:hypothetical protein